MKSRSLIALLAQIIAGIVITLIAATAIGTLLNRNSDVAFYLGVLASLTLLVGCVFAVTKVIERFRQIISSKEQ